MAADLLRVVEMTRKDMRRHCPAALAYPSVGYMAKRGNKLIAIGGLAWRWQRCDLWLEVRHKGEVPPLGVVRWARRMVRMAAQMGEPEVNCLRDAGQPASKKLLELLGFEYVAVQRITFVDGSTVDKEWWRCQV